MDDRRVGRERACQDVARYHVGEIRARERGQGAGGGKFGGMAVRAPASLHPEALAAKLARKVFTNGKSDLEMVAGIYARTLDGAFGGAEVLSLRAAAGATRR